VRAAASSLAEAAARAKVSVRDGRGQSSDAAAGFTSAGRGSPASAV
jgi:hypothetical protein